MISPFSFFRIFISFVFLFLSTSLLAQKCKYEKNAVDALTEFPIKLTTSALLTRINNEPVYVKAQCIGPHKYIKISYYTYGNFSYQEDREIAFTTTGGSEVVLYPRVTPKDTTTQEDYMNVTSLIVYKLTPEQYDILKQTPLDKFKYFISTGWVEETIKTSKQTTLMELLYCVE